MQNNITMSPSLVRQRKQQHYDLPVLVRQRRQLHLLERVDLMVGQPKHLARQTYIGAQLTSARLTPSSSDPYLPVLASLASMLSALYHFSCDL